MRLAHLAIAGLLSSLALGAAAQDVSISLSGGQTAKTWHGQADMQAISFEYQRSLSSRTEVGLVVSPMNLWQPRSWFGDQYGDGNETVRALAGSVLLRHHFGSDAARVRPFVELGAGPMWAEKAVPASTSRFNFVTQPGVGVTLFSQRRLALVVGYRFMHISNGGYSPRNPGVNAHTMALGVRMRR